MDCIQYSDYTPRAPVKYLSLLECGFQAFSGDQTSRLKRFRGSVVVASRVCLDCDLVDVVVKVGEFLGPFR